VDLVPPPDPMGLYILFPGTHGINSVSFMAKTHTTMIQRSFLPFLFVLLTMTLSSCQAIADIFSAGVWVGVILVVVVIGVIGFIISRMRG
jgi:hypothetical protein